MPVAIAEGVIFLFFVVFFISIGFACLFTRTKNARIFVVKWFMGIFFGPFVLFAVYNILEYFLEQIKTLPARKMFYTRCAIASEKVYKTADDVEGILLLNVRGLNDKASDLYWPDAALPYESRGDNYIRGFLKEARRYVPWSKGPIYEHYFLYLDIKEDNEFIRYRLEKEGGEKLKKAPSPSEPTRYAVSFINHDNTEDRKNGIAGTTVTIEDTLTGEIMAERTSYAFIPQFIINGSVNWHNAVTCPKGGNQYHSTKKFVNQVIKPKQEH